MTRADADRETKERPMPELAKLRDVDPPPAGPHVPRPVEKSVLAAAKPARVVFAAVNVVPVVNPVQSPVPPPAAPEPCSTLQVRYWPKPFPPVPPVPDREAAYSLTTAASEPE